MIQTQHLIQRIDKQRGEIGRFNPNLFEDFILFIFGRYGHDLGQTQNSGFEKFMPRVGFD
jgi:hypothetical protein